MTSIRPTEKGQTVMYAREFLRNTGQFFGENAQLTGKVSDYVDTYGICTIRWDNGEETRAMSSNLVLQECLHLELT